MKLNGALKPRQGASRKGSSPGVVLKTYRVKRYFKVIENVVNGLPLNVCGVKYKNLTENNIINRENIGIDIQRQQQHQTTKPLSKQLQQRRKCGQSFSSSNGISSNSLSRINFSTAIKIKKQIYLKIKQQTRQTRLSAIIKTTFCDINLSRGENNNNIPPTARATVAEEALELVEEYNKKQKKDIEIDFKQKAVVNITTRQINNTILKEERAENIKTNNVKSDDREIRQVKHNVTPNKGRHNSNTNKNSDHKEVNKFLFTSIPKLNEILTSHFFIQLKLLLVYMFSHAIKYLNGNPFVDCGGGGRESATVCRSVIERKGCQLSSGLAGINLAKMMHSSQLSERICFKNARGIKPSIALCVVIYAATAILLPPPVVGDDGDTFFPINGLETTTPEFDYASRGQKKFGDKCDNTLECGFPGSICDPKKKSCQCTEDLPVTNHIDKCGKEAAVNESCFFNEQCEVKYFQTECRDQRCVCRFDMTPVWLKDGSVECKGRGDKKGPETYIDPAMIGVLIGMALMFIIICVVLRLFSQARWRENRTIFNTPNPRLMNVSLLRESKLLHGQERRGSRMSVRAPSRQPSMASLRPHSPNPSLGKTGSRSNSHGSNASGTSLRSTRSNSVSPAGIAVSNNSHHERKGSTYQPPQQKFQPLQQQEEEPQTNITSNPVAETITVEIIEPEK